MNWANERGFTLLEMLIALVVVAGIASAAVLSLSGQVSALRAKAAVAEVAQELRAARLGALQKGRQVQAEFDLLSGTVEVQPDGRVVTLSDKLVLSVTVDRVRIEGSRAQLIFYPDGTSSGAEILAAIEDRNYLIEVDWLTGAIRQERLNDTL